jgi:hypothetical protein
MRVGSRTAPLVIAEAPSGFLRYRVIDMLTSGAAVVEAIAVWLYFQGYGLWVVAASAILGVALLLILDWAIQGREPRSSVAR